MNTFINLIPPKKRIAIFLVTVLGLVAAAFEALTVVSIHRLTENGIDSIGTGEFKQLLPYLLFPSITIFVSMIIKLLFTWSQARVSHEVSHEISKKYLDLSMNAKLEVLTIEQQEKIINVITQLANNYIYYNLIPFMSAVTGSCTLLALGVILVKNYGAISILILCLFALLYAALWGLTKHDVSERSARISDALSENIRLVTALNKGAAYIRLRKLSREIYRQFEENDRRLKVGLASINFLSTLPKSLIEGLVYFGFIGFMTYAAYTGDNLGVGDLVVIGLVGQKAMPLFHGLFNSVILFAGNLVQMRNLNEEINFLANNQQSNIISSRDVTASNLRKFQVGKLEINTDQFTLKLPAVDFEIGGKYLITGPSGSGKTSYLLHLMGLADRFEININSLGKNINVKYNTTWMHRFEYVQQEPFFVRGSVGESLSVQEESETNKTEIDRYFRSLGLLNKDPKNDDFNKLLKRSVETLSGGERQRLAIIRALMADKDILVFDEPTSALDHEASTQFFKLIEELNNKMIIIVSHERDIAYSYDKKIEFRN